jgi:hypothetical protein
MPEFMAGVVDTVLRCLKVIQENKGALISPERKYIYDSCVFRKRKYPDAVYLLPMGFSPRLQNWALIYLTPHALKIDTPPSAGG